MFDTPEKSRIPPASAAYTLQPEFGVKDLANMETTVERVLKDAAYWFPHNPHEATWADLVVSPILHLIRRLECLSNLRDSGISLDVLNMYGFIAVHPLFSSH